MCGKAYDPRFVFAWPTARYAVMSGDSAPVHWSKSRSNSSSAPERN